MFRAFSPNAVGGSSLGSGVKMNGSEVLGLGKGEEAVGEGWISKAVVVGG